MNEPTAAMEISRAYVQACAASTRVTEVQDELSQLSEMAQQLGEHAMTLCARLAPVQRVGGPSAGSAGTAPTVQPALCPIASELRSIREKLQITCEMIEANRNQLEI